MQTYKNGDKVWFQPWGGPTLPAFVTGFGEKNGRPLVDLRIEGETNPLERDRWGYLDQVTPRQD